MVLFTLKKEINNFKDNNVVIKSKSILNVNKRVVIENENDFFDSFFNDDDDNNDNNQKIKNKKKIDKLIFKY